MNSYNFVIARRARKAIMDALLAAYHHAQKYKTGRSYKGNWGQVCEAVELMLTVRDMNRFKRFCRREDLRSYNIKEYEEELYEQWFNAVKKSTANKLVYYSTLNEDEKEEYKLWFNHVKEGRIDGLVFKLPY